ncbi:Oxysterol-binding protein-like protein OBPa [Smittium mucronatum]|uniref:Oxysterol-binding protein-like protein OBPa n=1 Tax=Smittium mucronatum TaxID=133383 RepID=A0A1R0H1Y1_9FUNG|nr:Oxysterol-binding protein-like protein OBPa [Smittium mucronatum]
MPNTYEDSNNEELLDEEPRNVIISMISQLGTNKDLTRVTLPAFVLENRSFIERITDLMTYPQILLENECTLENGSKFQFISEQISHHPPVTAFANYCPDEEIYLRGEFRPKAKFLGNTIGIYLIGNTEIFFKKHDECYDVTNPNMFTRGLFFGKMVLEMGDKATITCKKTDLVFKVEFKTKGLFGGQYNEVTGKIKRLSTDETLYEVSGNWKLIMNIKKKKPSESKVLFDPSAEKRITFKVPSINDQEENESRRKWRYVTEALNKKDVYKANEEKTIVEEAQRASIKAMKSANTVWKPRFFKTDGGVHVPKLDFSSLSGDKADRDSQVRDFIFPKFS